MATFRRGGCAIRPEFLFHVVSAIRRRPKRTAVRHYSTVSPSTAEPGLQPGRNVFPRPEVAASIFLSFARGEGAHARRLGDAAANLLIRPVFGIA